MTTHTARILATLSGDLMSVDIDEVEIGDIMFMGGHLVRRVWTKSYHKTYGEYRVWQGLKLDQPTDGSSARSTYQNPIGQACLVFRSKAAF